MARKTKVALLFGGRSAEHEVSLVSAASIYSNLDTSQFFVTCIYINKQGEWRAVDTPLQTQEALNKGRFHSFLPWEGQLLHEIKADIYFPVLHGPYGEDGTIQGLFEVADVPYVGASVLASAAAMDKAVTKTLFRARNLPVVEHRIILEQEWKDQEQAVIRQVREEFTLPFFTKPANLGSSVGIIKVKDYEDIRPALERAFAYDRKLLVEEGIIGREFECSVLGNDQPQASLPGEIIPHREFYDYRDKYVEGRTTFVIPAELPLRLVEDIQRLAIAAFQAVDCSGMARVDFFYQKNPPKLLLSEINTIPGFTEISMYPKLWEASGLPYPQLLEKLIELGFERHRLKKKNVDYE